MKLHSNVMRSAALLGMLLVLATGHAQVGEPAERLLDRLGNAEPASPRAQEGNGGGYVLGDSVHFELDERGGLLYSVQGEATLSGENRGEVARLIGEATGYGEGIAGQIEAFLEQNALEIAAQPDGTAGVRVEQFVLELQAQGDQEPVQLQFDLRLAQVPESAFLEPSHSIGPADAPYVIREFADFQCPACANFRRQVFPMLEEEILSRGDVRFEFHHMPLKTIHANAALAAEASECVSAVNGDEGFWAFHDALFEYQRAWQGLGDPQSYFVRLVDELGLETDGVAACIDEREYRQEVDTSYQHAVSVLGVNSTPTVYVNGFLNRSFHEAQSYLDLFELVDAFHETP